MNYATKIRMKQNCSFSYNLTEIDSIYLQDQGWSKKEVLYDYTNKNPQSIKVANSNGPFLIPALSINGEKYVKSQPNDTQNDNLLNLHRE